MVKSEPVFEPAKTAEPILSEKLISNPNDKNTLLYHFRLNNARFI